MAAQQPAGEDAHMKQLEAQLAAAQAADPDRRASCSKCGVRSS